MSAREVGVIIAAPTPCTTRPTISSGMLGANPHTAEAATKTTMPMPYARRAPTRSDTVPENNWSAANINV